MKLIESSVRGRNKYDHEGKIYLDCSKCKKIKYEDEFYPRSLNSFCGREGVCKQCAIERNNNHAKNNREKINKQVKKRREKIREMLIYVITNKITGKKYIGQTTTTLIIRFNGHKQKAFDEKSSSYNSDFYSDIRKYGKKNFKIEKVCNCFTLDELNEKEKYFIQHFNTMTPNGYNKMLGGTTSIQGKEWRKRNKQIQQDISTMTVELAKQIIEDRKKMTIKKIAEKHNIGYGTAQRICKGAHFILKEIEN